MNLAPGADIIMEPLIFQISCTGLRSIHYHKHRVVFSLLYEITFENEIKLYISEVRFCGNFTTKQIYRILIFFNSRLKKIGRYDNNENLHSSLVFLLCLILGIAMSNYIFFNISASRFTFYRWIQILL